MMDDEDEGVKRRGKKHQSGQSSDMVKKYLFLIEYIIFHHVIIFKLNQ